MTQAHKAQSWQSLDQSPPGLTPYWIACSALVVSAGACFCVCVAVLGHQFLLALFLCVMLACISTWLVRIVVLMERDFRHNLLGAFTRICQAMLDGKYATRVPSAPESGELELREFGKTLNQLFDNYAYLQHNAQIRQQELGHLQDQMEQLLYEMRPVMDGDLSTRSTVADGALGSIAAMCNTLVEDTAQLVQWAQYMSDEIIQTSHQLMNLSLEIGQVMETFIRQHEVTTEAIEGLMAFTLRMESALFSNVEIFQDNWMNLRQRNAQRVSGDGPLAEPLGTQIQSAHANTLAITELFYDMPGQIKFLENLLQKTHKTTSLAESTIKELHSVEQRFQHIDGVVMQFASMIGSLATLADNWRQAADFYALPSSDSEEEDERFVETRQMLVPLPEQAT